MCVGCIIHSMPCCFNAVNSFQVVKEKGKKEGWLFFFTRFTVVEVIWLYLKIQQFAILISKSTTDNTSCHLGSAKADTDVKSWVLTINLREIHVECEIFRLVIKQLLLGRVGIHVRNSRSTCKQLQLRHICCSECSCTAGSFGGVFVSLHVANRVSGPALRGRLSSKLVLNIKL